eukprot:scaffold240530_cov30-Tisochrysis_lutea.AAC.3
MDVAPLLPSNDELPILDSLAADGLERYCSAAATFAELSLKAQESTSRVVLRAHMAPPTVVAVLDIRLTRLSVSKAASTAMAPPTALVSELAEQLCSVELRTSTEAGKERRKAESGQTVSVPEASPEAMRRLSGEKLRELTVRRVSTAPSGLRSPEGDSFQSVIVLVLSPTASREPSGESASACTAPLACLSALGVSEP